jgi:hypothetical protein
MATLFACCIEVEKLRFPRTIKHLGINAYYSNIGDAWTTLIWDKNLKLTHVLNELENVLRRK